MNIQEITESYLNGNLNDTKQAIFEKPWLQSDIYNELPESERNLFMERCRAWHKNNFIYKRIK